MQAAISPGNLYGQLQVPASKSMMQRVCAAALLHNGKTIITNPGRSDDDKAALAIIQDLGAIVRNITDNSIEVSSNGVYPTRSRIFCGESGLSARLFIPIASLSNKPVQVDGRGSLLNRPFQLYTHMLPQLNVLVQHNAGMLPFMVQGPLQPRDIKIDGSMSSQFLSGMLFAMGHAATTPVTIEVTGLKSKPYIGLTIQILKHFGIDIQHEDYRFFHIAPSPPKNEQVTITVEGDWSSAATMMVGAALTGDVLFTGLDVNSTQADIAILDVLTGTGSHVRTTAEGIRVSRAATKGFEFDATHCPDLFPALAILAACSKGETRIHGVHRLIHKESNRIESICDMLEAFSAFHAVEDDALYIEGQRTLEPAVVRSYHDHRIAMAAAIGALRAYDTVRIHDADAVSKSYPDFFTDLQKLGAHVRINHWSDE